MTNIITAAHMSAKIDPISAGRIVNKAISLGASLAGIVSAEKVFNAPSYRVGNEVPQIGRAHV